MDIEFYNIYANKRIKFKTAVFFLSLIIRRVSTSQIWSKNLYVTTTPLNQICLSASRYLNRKKIAIYLYNKVHKIKLYFSIKSGTLWKCECIRVPMQLCRCDRYLCKVKVICRYMMLLVPINITWMDSSPFTALSYILLDCYPLYFTLHLQPGFKVIIDALLSGSNKLCTYVCYIYTRFRLEVSAIDLRHFRIFNKWFRYVFGYNMLVLRLMFDSNTTRPN